MGYRPTAGVVYLGKLPEPGKPPAETPNPFLFTLVTDKPKRDEAQEQRAEQGKELSWAKHEDYLDSEFEEGKK